MILIKGVQVIDGEGKRKGYKADILVKDDKIAAIGSFPNKKADIIIDGLGSYVTPGFIDVKTNIDHYLSIFNNPQQADFLRQGVTTVIGGHCGASLAPLLYGTLESIRKWADINSINVDWRTMREFLDVMEKRPLGVNFATLVGHSTVRRAIIGEELRDLTEHELEIFSTILTKSLNEGAFGFSTGLGYAHSRQTPYFEIKKLVDIVARHNGVYTTHLRNEEDGLLSSINETIKVAEETGARTIISHFRPLKGYENDYRDALLAISNVAAGAELYYDIYPFDTSVVAIYTLLPKWAQNGGLEVMLANIESESTRKKIIQELPDLEGDDIVIAQSLHNDYLVGKSIKEIAENRNISLKEALLEIMSLTKLRTTVFYKNINKDLIEDAILRDEALVASNSAGLPDAQNNLKHERFYNTFPKFLEIVAEKKAMTIEKAIYKITGLPARIYGLHRRGVIKEGNFADLTLIKNNKIEAVLVNGKLAVKTGEIQNVMNGKILRK